MNTVTIDGIEYQPVNKSDDYRIIIGQRGWVFVGRRSSTATATATATAPDPAPATDPATATAGDLMVSHEERQRLREQAERVADLCAGTGVSLPAAALLALLDELDKKERQIGQLREALAPLVEKPTGGDDPIAVVEDLRKLAHAVIGIVFAPSEGV